MTPQLVVRPASKGSSVISYNELSPQPLDLNEPQARSHDQASPNAPDLLSSSSPVTLTSPRNDSVPPAFHRLPRIAISKILWHVDANEFASLAILNKAWYNVAQDRDLYAHHLSRCPSYALSNTVITGPFRKNDLFRLKTKFAAEVRRNLFRAYLKPRQTFINLISVNASSSAALPGAEAFRFSFSPNGQTMLALSSSRIYVIDATTDPIFVRKELKTLRRPLAASVTDDGTTLAVLSSKHQANIYNLTPTGVKHVQVLVMDNPPRTIALAPEGTVLAAAYEGGVEVFSLAQSALSTDRRAVRSEAVDALSFSGDGSMLVGSTQSLEEPSSVVITAPFYTENDLPPKEVHSRMWTTQILFPQISSICSHADLLQGHTEGDANWLFAYDHTLMSYRAVRTDDTRTGVAYFLNPASTRRFSLPAPTTAPTATMDGTLVVAGFSGTGLWMYGVPEKLDVSPDMGSVVERHEQSLQNRMGVALTTATGRLEPLMAYSPSISGSSEEFEDDSIAAKVDWRESLFVKCEHLRTIDGVTAAKWVERSEERECGFKGKRLIVVAPGGVDHFVEELGDETMPVDGSRLSVLDFDYAPSTLDNSEITIEVGEMEPELLTEQIGDMEIEVAMERRRTVRDRTRGARSMPLGRSATNAMPSQGLWAQRRPDSSGPSSPLDVDAQMERTAAAAAAGARSPKSPSTNLHRAATTAAGYTTARYPPRPPLSAQMGQSRNPIRVYSPGDGWESPPPPYTTGGNLHIQPAGMLGSPLIQPHQPPGQGAGPMPLTGIPENGIPSRHAGNHHFIPDTSRMPAAPGSMPQSHMTSNVERQFQPQPVTGPPQITSPASPETPAGITPGHYGPAGVNIPPLPGQTFQPSEPFHEASQAGPVIQGSMPDHHFTPYPHQHPQPSSRPVSHDERPSPLRTPISQRDHVPDHRIPSPLNDRPTGNAGDLMEPSSTNQAQNRLSTSSVTLTGANLQARLNHPVPPPPTVGNSILSENATAGIPSTNLPSSSHETNAAIPHSDQAGNLKQTSPQSHLNIGSYAPIHDPNSANNLLNGQPHQPHPVQIAHGSSASPVPYRPAGLANGLANGAVGSSSSSTPNLHAMAAIHAQQTGDQLTRIESIPGAYGRRQGIGYNQCAPGGPPMHPNQGYHQQQPYMSYGQPSAAYVQMPGGWMPNQQQLPFPDPSGRRVSSDPSALETPGKKKRGRRKKGEPIAEPGRSQTPMPMMSSSNQPPPAATAPPPAKKGSRCLVM
ncbi:hypothetical protein B0A52_02107 [Exophiala mesophila]|uniref:F-box domain-containing protein n=1 Tax=Exophiala mesophila TaxID=212818 RepID=A0A438NEW3_EXOME|nr:hypothetical protein B0A52_02107 [Exophiala mesophila]